MDIRTQIIKETGLEPFKIKNTLDLFEEEATIPFVARYRKERTGSLTETELRDIYHKHQYYNELEERKQTILKNIEEQGKLTAPLRKAVEGCLNKTTLEDLYLPYKKKRLTKGRKAIEAGLEPMAEYLISLKDKYADVEETARKYLNKDKGVETASDVIKGACNILAERLSESAEIRSFLREHSISKGAIRSRPRKDYKDKKTKFSGYYDFSEPVKTIPSHRVLALFRGEKEKILMLSLEYDDERIEEYLFNRLVKHPGSAAQDHLAETARDAHQRLLKSVTETSVRKIIRERAEQEALKVFNQNLKSLLLAPPAGKRPAIGLDPGYRTGCKAAVVNDTGRFMEYRAIFPTTGEENRIREASETMKRLIGKYGIEVIAVGNGTAGREALDFVKRILKESGKEQEIVALMASEAGASVYSASEAAAKEFPDQDVTVRGAISIARRVQDPLSELVKIDPKSIGVGQYQHDVNQKKLKRSLEEVVESCVNQVGVDLNHASEELLMYISGLNRTSASKIVAYRDKNGAFPLRERLLKVDGIGERAFQQSAGFLRIPESTNPLDNSSVHPERYELVNMIAEHKGITLKELIGSETIIDGIDPEGFAYGDVGVPTIKDILEELKKPGRDPRKEFKYADFTEGVSEISDLSSGMVLEGTVTNVTNFGAFVDIGVHQDGLVHISQLSDSFVKDPSMVVNTGDIVKVRVMDIDEKLKRISLSMKTNPEHKKAAVSNKKKGEENKKTGKPAKNIKPKFSVKQLMR
ncbi:MAG: Tex family protein [Chitinivibrionales bacterium]